MVLVLGGSRYLSVPKAVEDGGVCVGRLLDFFFSTVDVSTKRGSNSSTDMLARETRRECPWRRCLPAERLPALSADRGRGRPESAPGRGPRAALASCSTAVKVVVKGE